MRLSESLKYSIEAGARFDSLATTQSLREYCLANGWPAELVNNLSVINNGSEHTIYYPPYLGARVIDLEYTPETPTFGTLRKFLDQINDAPFVEGMLEAMF